jgi:dynein heavy chain
MADPIGSADGCNDCGGSAAGAKDPSNFSYTIAAARRSEQRKLLCFVKLADFVICDTLHNLLLDSERDLLAFCRPAPTPVRELTDADREAMAAMSPAERKEAEEAHAASMPVPLCEVQVLLDGDSLEFVPAPEEYQKEMDVMVHGFVSTLCTVTRLLAQDELMTQVLEPGVDIEMGSSLAELIECDIHTELTAEIKFAMVVAFDAAEERKQLYKPFQGLCAVNQTRDAETLKAQYLAKERTLQVSECCSQ